MAIFDWTIAGTGIRLGGATSLNFGSVRTYAPKDRIIEYPSGGEINYYSGVLDTRFITDPSGWNT